MLAATDGQSSCNQWLAETWTAASGTLLPKCDNELQRTVLLQQASAHKIIYIYIYIIVCCECISHGLKRMYCRECSQMGHCGMLEPHLGKIGKMPTRTLKPICSTSPWPLSSLKKTCSKSPWAAQENLLKIPLSSPVHMHANEILCKICTVAWTMN